MILRSFILAALITLAGGPVGAAPPSEREALIRVLKQELSAGSGWNRIRAAEALVDHGHAGAVEQALATETETAPPPERIGIWRVMARAAQDEAQRNLFAARIRNAMVDPDGPDRIHAAESLAKLGRVEASDGAIAGALATAGDAAAVFPQWVAVLAAAPAERAAQERRLAGFLASEDPVARLRAAFAVGRLNNPSPESLQQLQAQLAAEPADSPARAYILAALVWQSAAGGNTADLKRQLQSYLQQGRPNEQFEAATTLGCCGGPEDISVLRALLSSGNADARIGAAQGLLQLARRLPHRMAGLDWVVIALYLGCLMGVGVYYSRQSKTRDDYLLGGRNMKAWAVGLSYFATIFSTITYMSWPGEIIKNGPMMLAQILAFPFAILLVGWFIIPFIMRLRVTSGYEILEARLGVTVRLLGSIFFLSMRLLWMAVILYTTTRGVLVPVAGLDPALAPWIAALMGLVTVIYTSMGGFKAVVVTDVAQTLILFGGALLALAVITSEFGGFGWFPREWNTRWQEPVFYDPTARISFVSAFVSLIAWHVCTAGADQMAIQRYLATRDVKAARRMFGIALSSNAIVFLVLAALGLALFAYFQARPEMMQIGQDFATNADQLFPQFIVFGLPAGISGLVVAGLLAAAMSSLSSGVSSASSVITVDFIERRRRTPAQPNDARTARIASWFIGAVVVGLSSTVGIVQGNLLEVAFKVINLLTAPLFGLFFMAMFVRFATPFGTCCGALAGIVTAVLVNYWREFTGSPGISFLWSMPLALTVQIVVGCAASLLPVGPSARPMLATDTEPSAIGGTQNRGSTTQRQEN